MADIDRIALPADPKDPDDFVVSEEGLTRGIAERRARKQACELLDYDSAEHFADPSDQIALLRDAIEQGDPEYLAHVRAIIARATGARENTSD